METRKIRKLELEEFLLENLSHGSGINGKWNIEIKKNHVSCNNFFHCMNENGFYDGFIDFDLKIPIVENALIDDIRIVRINYKENRNAIRKYWDMIDSYLYETLLYSIFGENRKIELF